jgi:hypothetical protein
MGVVDRAFESIRGLRVGDFFNRELPPEAIESIERLIDTFISADPMEREDIVERVEFPFAFVFQRYALLAAVGAIRRNDPGLLSRGLIALAISTAKTDWRDVLPLLALIYRSAVKLNLSPLKLFHEAGQVALPSFRQLLDDFCARDEGARTIEFFHYKEVGEGANFAYVYVERASHPPSKAKLRLIRFLRRFKNSFR